MLRSVLAILAGFASMAVAVMIFTVLAVQAFHVQNGHPTPAYLAVNVAYSCGAALLGGWVAARIAGRKPALHSAILALIMFLASGAALVHPSGEQPLGYQIFLCLGLPLFALAGGLIARRQLRA